MNLQEQLQLIKRLKRYPRHGQATDPLKQVEIGLKQVFDLYKIGGDEIIRRNVFGELSNQISKVVDNLTSLQQLNQGLSQGFGINTNEAAKFGVQIETIAKSLGLNAQKQKQFVVELTNLFGGSTNLYKKTNKYGQVLIQQNNQLRGQLQVSEQAYENFVGFQAQALVYQDKTFQKSRESFADVAAQFEQLGYKGAFKDIIEGFTELDARQRATFGKMPGQLGLALFKAKQLDVSLSSITDGAKGFLDVESAIGKEIEFQVLSGEKLETLNGESLTVAMQQAVLQQDANKQVELFAGFVQKYGNQLRDNIFLQETAAEIFGLQTDDIFKALEGSAAQQIALDGLSKTAIDLFNTSVDASIAAVDNYEKLISLGDIRTEQEKQQDRNIIGYMSTLGDYTQEVSELNAGFENASNATFAGAGGLANRAINSGKGLVGTAVGLMNVGSIIVDVLKFGTNPANLTTLQQSSNLPLATPKEDLFMPASSGNIISGPLGSFSLNAQDDILAMPGIGRAVGGTRSTNSDSIGAAVAAALKGMRFQVTNVFDGQKVRSSLAILDDSTLNNTNII